MNQPSYDDIIREHDYMGRLIAWLVDPAHDLPKVSSETRNYMIQYMRAILNGKEPPHAYDCPRAPHEG